MTDDRMTGNKLLARNALAGQRVALSVSDSPDLDRLGLLDAHFRLALGEIARTVLTAEGKLGYGGHVEPAGLTTFLATELERWRKGAEVLGIYLPWPVHRNKTVTSLRTFEDLLDTTGTTHYLGVDGQPIAHYFESRPEPEQGVSSDEAMTGLTGMRKYVTQVTDARVLLGGKRTGFTGRIPGLMEEALLSLAAGQPLFLAGGFGGSTHDIARVLQVDDGEDWLPGVPGRKVDDKFRQGLQELEQWRNLHGAVPDNGLTDEENRRLAATHRPSEIAALIALGVGRLPPRPESHR